MEQDKYITIRIKAPRIENIWKDAGGVWHAVVATGNSVMDRYYHELVSDEAKAKMAELIDIIYKELEAK